MIKKILIAPNPKLNKISKRVQSLNKETINLINNLTDTLLSQMGPKGVGLAAPQIGVLKQIFVLRFNDKDPVEIVINPEILKLSKKTNSAVQDDKNRDLEGCLSLPGVYAFVERPWKIKVRYLDKQFNLIERDLVGLEAIAYQHELDHLNGILFTQRALDQDQEIIHG